MNDYKNDIISKDDFEYYNKSYLYELNNLKLEKEKIENNKNKKIDLDWINKIKNIGKINDLNKFIVNEFIDNIYVTEDRNIKMMISTEIVLFLLYIFRVDNDNGIPYKIRPNSILLEYDN